MAQEFQTADEFHGYLRNKAVEDEAFRARLLSEPKAVMEEELDMKVPDDFTIEVHENTANTAHLVLPPSAALAEEELQYISGGHAMDWCSPV